MLGDQTLLQKVWLSGGVGRSEPEHGSGKGIQWGLAGWTTALEGHPSQEEKPRRVHVNG